MSKIKLDLSSNEHHGLILMVHALNLAIQFYIASHATYICT